MQRAGLMRAYNGSCSRRSLPTLIRAVQRRLELDPLAPYSQAEFQRGSASDRRVVGVIAERYLHKLTERTWTGMVNLSEPQATSDLGGVRTRAVPAVCCIDGWNPPP
jgi:hypothetical protein